MNIITVKIATTYYAPNHCLKISARELAKLLFSEPDCLLLKIKANQARWLSIAKIDLTESKIYIHPEYKLQAEQIEPVQSLINRLLDPEKHAFEVIIREP